MRIQKIRISKQRNVLSLIKRSVLQIQKVDGWKVCQFYRNWEGVFWTTRHKSIWNHSSQEYMKPHENILIIIKYKILHSLCPLTQEQQYDLS